MTITLQAVNELIASLESAGELSIKETKVMALAKAFKQLAAENVALKLKGRELLNEASKVYQKYNATIDFYSGDFMDGQTLHEFQFVLDAETSATDAYLAGIKADGVDIIRNALIKFVEDEVGPNDVVPGLIRGAEVCVSLADSLREGADK
ncbi:hypothetical protein NWT87_19625 [Klebsiella pneumoniae]|uniref:hypothetical protein n=1 Tax=Klebsiella pneumoniae TaxID=573 RepID=UPI0021AC173C|nr:hypothetical protein [Klebsiella pneumoniae]UVF98906.1 hypothetical protein NWT87_19625 [Klebsiella pneumoniae]UVG04392.1 hypothetical protein M2890_19625 [Klebsiella pneumoniae]